ncbi:PAS domain-containing protein [Pseudophaeobacter sp.]|uniref:hybrid sensor histidine kinase/response regulator n=1 Tax=Pseudophaeobacter sp. TaxID=1971739 RepID=UPI0032976D4B
MPNKKQAARSLPERLSRALELNGDGIWEWDLSARNLVCSLQIRELLGIPDPAPPDFAEGLLCLVHPDDLERIQGIVANCTPDNCAFSARFQARLPTGAYLWVDVKGATTFDPSGTPSIITGTLTKLSNKQIPEPALIAKIRQFENLAENIPGALNRYLIQADGSQTMDYVSPGFFEITELTPEDIAEDSSKLWQIIHEDDVTQTAASVEHSAITLEKWEQSFRLCTASGAVKWLHGRGRPWRREDGVTVFDSVIIDITDLKEAEESLRKSREMLAQSQKLDAIGQLTGGVAHDFNNLLAVILGNLELLGDTETSAEKNELIETAITASLRGGDLTKNMLSFARQAPLTPVTLDLNQVIEEAKNWIGRALPKTVSLQTALVDQVRSIEADQSSLESALLNLIINARDAMEGQGSLTIESSNVQIDEAFFDMRDEELAPGQYVMLAVSDTGPGIKEDILPEIFEPFFTTKPPGVGSGLGLSMVVGFMRQSGGTVQVYSEPGKGTTFKLFFPVMTDNGKAPEQAGEVAEPASEDSMKLLLVEDEEAVRNTLVKTLAQAGYQVTAAATGDDAFALFQADPTFDLVLTDIVMPGELQGTGLAKALREQWPELPVVFMSGYAREATVHGNGLRPEDIRLMKPVRRNALLEAAKQAMTNQAMG